MFQQPNLIGVKMGSTNVSAEFLPPLQKARASGPVEEYKFVNIRPKKKLKELKKVMLPEKKKLIILKYSFKFNLKDRCVVCGMHHLWAAGDLLRPPLPLTDVTKGRPMRGTYCPKHSSMHRQLEMLQQQILAEEHGLEFSAFKPRMPNILKKGPLQTLSKEDVITLTSTGWIIKPPSFNGDESPPEELIRLTGEIKLAADRIDFLMEKGA
tara:strand:+ start:64 stop:693 length:630 start_codon:yes stop_codon:yes gene_type:complete